MANTDYLSGGTTVFSNLSLSGVASVGSLIPAKAIDLRSNAAVVSLDTRANAASMSIGQLRLVYQASGISLVYSSGLTVYVVGQSAQSAAQA